MTFLTFKDLAHTHLAKRSMAYNNYLTFLFLEENDPIAAKSAVQILSLNLAWHFLFLICLVTGLCNSLSSCSCTLTPFTRTYLFLTILFYHAYSSSIS